LGKKGKKQQDKDEEKRLTKRLFIAVDLPDSLKNYLYKTTSNLSKKDSDIRVTPASNIHITLKFLGEFKISRIEKLSAAIKKTASSFSNFSYTISDKLGAFPGINSARILFVSISDSENKIREVFKELEKNLAILNIKREDRKFISHITLARIRDKKDITDIIKDVKICYERKLDCSKLTLFESILKKTGAEYVILEEFDLK